MQKTEHSTKLLLLEIKTLEETKKIFEEEKIKQEEIKKERLRQEELKKEMDIIELEISITLPREGLFIKSSHLGKV